VENDPVNLIDPTGNIPERCKENMKDKAAYARCVAQEHDVDYDWFKLIRYRYTDNSGDELFDKMMDDIQQQGQGCYSGAVPYRATGYVEGASGGGAAYIGITVGDEVVYNFAKFERTNFRYKGGYLTDSAGVSTAESVGVIKGFRSWKNIDLDYSDWFIVGSIGVGTNFIGELGVSIGRAWFAGVPDPSIRGTSLYVAASLGAGDVIPIIEPAVNLTKYTRNASIEDYIVGNEVDIGSLLEDIRQGFNSPWKISAPAGIGYVSEEVNFKYWLQTWGDIHKYKVVYEDVNQP
jgi:hypothetical protein